MLSLTACGAAGGPPAVESLPGAPAFDAALAARLERARADKDADYKPRTRHLREDGSPRYTNRLILESSPYLEQHAHNPVNWYPWGDEAFEAARALGRPVLLSIGYSTCHWCHVMEQESFEDEEIAAYLNAHYVAIKVDREERPDIDAIYMNAVQLLSGRGGWPMTAWLTPDRRPFFGGTYFPPRDGDRGVETGFLTLLRWLEQHYRERPQQVTETAADITRRIQVGLDAPASAGLPGLDVVDSLVDLYARSFDAEHGGLRQVPKFPSGLPLRLLLRQHRRTGRQDVLRMVTLTLDKMAAGGIRDHVGGGFHRYSTDRAWLVPHFEKMLYDNALLATTYLEGYQATGQTELAEVSRSILRYVEREMTSASGGFYSATDADSADGQGHAHEGWFFTWTEAEISEALGPAAAAPFQAFYGVTPEGNLEGRSILHEAVALDEVARRFEQTPDELRAGLAGSRQKLYETRSKRSWPLCDDKILTSWNGLMISAFARAAFVLDDPSLLDTARRAARHLLEARQASGRLRHAVAAGEAGRVEAFLEDYAFFVAGLLDLYESSGEKVWLERAIELQAVLDERYRDASRGGYFMTSHDHEALLAREKPIQDGAEPSGNAVTLLNLLRLHALTARDAYRAAAEALLRAFASTIRDSPELLVGLELYRDEAREIVIVTPRERDEARPFLDVLRTRFLPHAVRVVAVDGDEVRALASIVPPLAGKVAREGRATAYVCRRGACELPTTDVAVFAEQLSGRAPR